MRAQRYINIYPYRKFWPRVGANLKSHAARQNKGAHHRWPPQAESDLDPKSGCEIYGTDLGRRHKGRGQRPLEFLVAAGPGNQTGPGNLPNKNSPGAGQNG